MDLLEKSVKVQKWFEDKVGSFGKGKYGRVLKMARKPDAAEVRIHCPAPIAPDSPPPLYTAGGTGPRGAGQRFGTRDPAGPAHPPPGALGGVE